MTASTVFTDLPVELLYEIHLFSLSCDLPLVTKRFYDVFASSSTFYKAQYLLGRSEGALSQGGTAKMYSMLLRYRLCTLEVLDNVVECLRRRKHVFSSAESRVELPKRLFRGLKPHQNSTSEEEEQVLLFLRHLRNHPGLPRINWDSHQGYPLSKAVHSGSVRLATFLLDRGASPEEHGCIAAKIVIRQKDLAMLKLLVEYIPSRLRKSGKKRKPKDRFKPDSTLLKLAVEVGANDVVEYLYREKKVMPDMGTLNKMSLG